MKSKNFITHSFLIFLFTIIFFSDSLALKEVNITVLDGNGNLTIGRAMNAGETFGPEGITPSGWGWVHLTTDMNLINDLMEAGRPYSASATISLSDLNSLAQANDMLLFGDNMREIRVPNYLLTEFASKLR